MRPQGVGLLTTLIVLAAVVFGIGAGLEKASRTGSPVVHREAAGGIEPGASSESAVPGSEVVLGFNPESTPLILAALLGSAALGVGVWLYWRRPAIFWVAAVTMAAFAVVDVVEMVHQVAEQHPALVLIAAAVALLHGGAAALALRLTGASFGPRARAGTR